MNLTTETVAELIFRVSNLRHFEKEYEYDPNWYKINEVKELQRKVDEFLEAQGIHKFISKEDLIQMLNNPLKKAI